MKATYNDNHLEFLKTKINEIRVAIFKPEMKSELNLPNNIIQVLKVEDDGTLFFFTSCAGNHAVHLDRSFYGYLNFYRKGCEGRLLVSGKAEIVETDDEDLFSKSNYSAQTMGRLVLVKLKMMQAEFLETGVSQPRESFMDRMKHVFSQLLFTPTHKVYDFS